MESKRSKARNLVIQGKTKEALRIVKKFDLIYSKEEMEVLQIAYECLTGNETFYKQLGKDTDNIKAEAEVLLQKMIN